MERQPVGTRFHPVQGQPSGVGMASVGVVVGLTDAVPAGCPLQKSWSGMLEKCEQLGVWPLACVLRGDALRYRVIWPTELRSHLSSAELGSIANVPCVLRSFVTVELYEGGE